MKSSSGGALPILAAAVTGIQVGAAIVATRFVIAQSTPVALALLRYLIGLVCLGLPVLLSGRIRFARRDLLPIALLGITQFGIVVALLNYALQFIPSAQAALLFATFPLQSLLLAALLGHEQITSAKVAGVLLTVLGVGLALDGWSGSNVRHPTAWLGELAALASAFSGALCSVLYRPYLRKYPTLQVSAVAMLAAVLFLAVLAVGEGFYQTLPHFTSAGWLAVFFIGVGSGIGYYLWLWALRHAPATQVTVWLALSPLTSTGLGIFLLHEQISQFFIVGLGCVALGLWLALRKPVLL